MKKSFELTAPSAEHRHAYAHAQCEICMECIKQKGRKNGEKNVKFKQI